MHNRGIVLLALLWVLSALALVALNLASTVRTETTVAQASGEAERAYFYARGGLEEAIYRIVFPDKDPEKQKRVLPYAEGLNHYWKNNGKLVCHVAISDEAGKIDLNFASKEILANLLKNVGVADSLSESIAEAIVKWRQPRSEETEKDSEDSLTKTGRIKHHPFASVEELLLVNGVSREILYGVPRRNEDGKVVVRRGLAEFVTVYSGQTQININYAEPEVIAALPGLDLQTAEMIIEARTKEPLKSSSDLSQRVMGLIDGKALPFLATEFSSRYCLVATAFVKDSNVRRSIKLVAKRDDLLAPRHERLIWYDEYWPLDRVLKWTEVRPEEE
jgi:general secretion pathway protein K